MIAQTEIDTLRLNWIDESGLGLLDPLDKGYVPNANGILFLAYDLMLLGLGNGLDFNYWEPKVHLTLLSLRRQNGYFGYYKRRVDDDEPEAHDNYIGILSLAVLLGYDDVIAEINAEGRRTGYLFDGVAPQMSDDFRYQRQGGDIAFYQYCAGDQPTPWDVVWMAIGMCISYIQNDPSSMNLGWLRRQAMDVLRAKGKPFRKFDGIVLGLSFAFCGAMEYFRGGRTAIFLRYFRADHPVISFSGSIYGN